MNKPILILAIAVLLILVVGLSGCLEESTPKVEVQTPNEGDLRLSSIEQIGGKYNASILKEEIFSNGNWSNTYRTSIVYVKDNKKYIGNYDWYLSEALNWIKSNTTENDTILCWWEYGHMVEGYSERNIISKFPSLATNYTMWEYMNDERWIRDFTFEWSANETIEDIMNIFSSNNITSNETKDLIEKYNISYILIHGKDRYLASNIGNETLMAKMWEKGYNYGDEIVLEEPQIYGLQLVYISSPYISAALSDTRIFKVL